LIDGLLPIVSGKVNFIFPEKTYGRVEELFRLYETREAGGDSPDGTYHFNAGYTALV